MENTNTQSLFTEEELKILGLTPEENEALLDADSIAKTADLLPEEPDGILDEIDSKFESNDVNEILATFNDLAESNPEFIKNIIAMNEIFADVKDV